MLGASCVWEAFGRLVAGRLLGGSYWNAFETLLGGFREVVWRPLGSSCEVPCQVDGTAWEIPGMFLLGGRLLGVCWEALGIVGRLLAGGAASCSLLQLASRGGGDGGAICAAIATAAATV